MKKDELKDKVDQRLAGVALDTSAVASVRSAALLALGRSGGDYAFDVICEVLEFKIPVEVHQAGLEALGEIGRACNS